MAGKPKPVRAPIVAPEPMGELAVQLVRAPGLLSHAIAWWGSGWDDYSHADIRLSDGSLLGARSDRIRPLGGGPIIPPGVRVRPAGYARWERRTLYTRPVRANRIATWERLARSKVGTAYDRAGILRLILGHEPVEDGREFCSCLVITLLQEFGEASPVLSLAPQSVSPDALGFGLTMGGWAMRELPV